jgi:transcription termination factor Rho
MSDSTEQSLLEPEPAKSKKPAARKATATKATSTKAGTTKAKATPAKSAKAPARKAATKRSSKGRSQVDEQPELPVIDLAPEEVAPQAVSPTPAPAIAEQPMPVIHRATASEPEEWRPSAPSVAAANASAQPSPLPAVAPVMSDAMPGAKARPVYIPLHVAKQMEEQARLGGDPNPVVPIALPATEAARIDLPQREPRMEMAPREPRVEVPLREEELGEAEGLVEVSGKGFGFLRDPKRGYAQHPNDVFVTPEICRTYNLRDGQWVKGDTRRGNRGAQLFRLTEINGDPAADSENLPVFDELTVISPLERIKMETTAERYTTRVIDLLTPIGKGQRGLIVAPPRTGKTTLLQHIADAVVKNHPDIKLIILLVDERPEEVTEIKRTVPTAELMASSNDSDIKSHTRIAQLAIERAKRLVEAGKDVFVLLDSITRVGRAFNNAMGGGGRTMSGGIDSRALEIPRKLFAAARNTEEAGSLTIIATALIDTGSRMDELIFQEFKGTGNMELVLDRKISDQRIYPAVDLFQSGTRREELLIPADDLHKINVIRRGLAGHKPLEAMERLLFFLRKFPTNSQMLREIPG